MSILGVESVVFGVDDLDSCARFWVDFGLTERARTGDEAVFEVVSGSRVIVRRGDDRRLPPRNFEGSGIRLTIWGVDTADNLEALVARVATDTAVRRDPDGTAYFQAPDGQHLGLRVWAKRPVISCPIR